MSEAALLAWPALERGKKLPPSYLGHRGRKDDHLVQLAHSFHKLIHPRPFDDVDIMVLAFNLDGDGEVGLVQDLRSSGQIALNIFTVSLVRLEACMCIP